MAKEDPGEVESVALHDDGSAVVRVEESFVNQGEEPRRIEIPVEMPEGVR
jgi:hypothetical protein